AFLLPAVDVRWGTAARTHERFNEGILAVGVLAGRQEAVHVADEGDGAALLGGSDNWLHWIGFLPILRAVSSRTSSPARSSRSTGRRLDAFPLDQHPALHRPAGDVELVDVRLLQRLIALVRAEPHDEGIPPDADEHVAVEQEADAAEHLL